MPQRRSALNLCFLFLLAWLTALLGAAQARADGYKTATSAKEPPETVAKEMRGSLQKKRVRVVAPDEKSHIDLWLNKKLATKKVPAKLGADFGQVPDGSLLGVAQFHAKTRDFRGRSFAAGVYTLRKITLPEDGDHLGVSETLDFVLLCRVEDDTKPQALAAKDVVELSAKVSRRKHPSILYLIRMTEKEEKLPRMVEDEDREYWILDVEVPTAEEGKPVRLGLIVEGEAEE